MHRTAMRNGELFFSTYKPSGTIIEIGSMDVNGSLRSVAPAKADYVGVDFAEGPGVDVVLTDPYKLPFEDASADCIVSSSCFEHAEFFWLSFMEALRILKPAGLFWFSAPSNGPFHRYPVDCWRFYPDSGLALEHWARRNGVNAALLESYTSRQGRGQWNDYVAVFVKDAAHAPRKRVLDTFKDYTNGYVRGREGFSNPAERPEDQSGLARSLSYRFRALVGMAPD